MKKLKNRLISKWWQFKDWIREEVNPKLPKIPTRKPNAPHGGYCPKCCKDMDIHAYDTGDGWMFWWDCENEHWMDKEMMMIIGWFPFVFGWATYDDLRRIGIEVM
jgi:hypothetical protein